MTVDTTSKILKILEKQEKEEGKLPLLLQFYSRLLQTQSKAQKRSGVPKNGMSGEAIQRRLRKGLPLIGLKELELELDWALVQDTFAKIAGVFAGYPELFGELHERLKKPGAGRLLTKKALKAWFTGKELPATMLEVAGDNLLQAIIQATMQPFLANQARALMGAMEQRQWRRTYCPICGGSPDMASLKKDHGARWLLCSRCDTEWLYQRLECPFCGNKDQESMSYFTDEKDLYRLYVCDKCKCYLKAIDLRKVEDDTPMPLERLYTIDLDAQAKEHGYVACQKTVPNRK